MKREQVDQFFEKKLNQLEVKPSAEAWEKLDSQLNKKRKWVYYRVAASVILIATTATILAKLTIHPEDTVPQVAQHVEPVEEILPEITSIVPKEEEKSVLDTYIERRTKEIEEQNQQEQVKDQFQIKEQGSVAVVVKEESVPIEVDEEINKKDVDAENKVEIDEVLLASAQKVELMPVTITYKKGVPKAVADVNQPVGSEPKKIDKFVSNAEGLIYESKHALKRIKSKSEGLFALNLAKGKKDKKKLN